MLFMSIEVTPRVHVLTDTSNFEAISKSNVCERIYSTSMIVGLSEAFERRDREM